MRQSKLDVDALAEELRDAVSTFVRTVRAETATVRTAKSDTLEMLEANGAANVAMLAQKRNVKHQSMRLVTGQLEADGLIRREVDPADRRSQLFVLTDTGRDWLARSRELRSSRIAAMIRTRLSAGERQELRTAARLLLRLASAPDE
jgi:DNA-binding MarR family transcriptional regulator